MPITYLNLRDQLELSLKLQNIPYIKDLRKENGAINTFMMEGVSPEQILELIGKLIAIKRHPKMGQDKFWIGCAVNIHCALSYRVQIETVYLSIAPDGNDKGVATNSQSPEVKPKKRSWLDFLDWAKASTTKTRYGILQALRVEEREDEIRVYGLADGISERMVEEFFKGTKKVVVK